MIWLVLLVPIIAAVLAPFARGKAGILAFLALLFSFLFILPMYPAKALTESAPWVPQFGLSISFRVDWLSYPLTLLIALVSALAALYSMDYMKDREDQPLYYACLLLFAAGMMGVTLSSDMILFYLFWEVMVLSSFFLISEWGNQDAKQASVKYFIYMRASALALLFGILWVHAATGSFELSPGLAGLTLLGFLPFLLAFCIKLAIFPFHNWLPDAYSAAPAPVSAMLGGLMVNMGAYGLLRFSGMFAGIGTLSVYIALFAVITILYGAFMALRQDSLKRLWAWSSVSQTGYLLFGFAALGGIGLTGTALQMITHGATKALLFLVAGAVVYAAGTDEISKLGSLGGRMPKVAVLAFIGGLSLAGIPLFAVFQSEWMIFAGGLQFPALDALAMLAALLTLAYVLLNLQKVFMKVNETMENAKLKEVPWKMMLAMAVLAIVVLLLGIYPSPIMLR